MKLAQKIEIEKEIFLLTDELKKNEIELKVIQERAAFLEDTISAMKEKRKLLHEELIKKNLTKSLSLEENEMYSSISFSDGNSVGRNIGSSGKSTGMTNAPDKDGLMVRLTNVSIDNIYSERDETISLKLIVNADGIITTVTKLPKTTTTNQVLINQVIDAVKKQVKFSKGGKVETHYYTIKINGHSN